MSIEYETFPTKREAEAWKRDCDRRKPGERHTIIPISEVPDDRARRGRFHGHRWAMRWVSRGESVRIPGLNA